MAEIGHLIPGTVDEAIRRITREIGIGDRKFRWEPVKQSSGDISMSPDCVHVVKTDKGDRTARLAAASPGSQFAIRQIGASNTCTVVPPAGHTINGASSLSLSSGAGATIVFVGGKEWVTI